MVSGLLSIKEFFQYNASVVHVSLTRVRGSAPRDTGTQMFVTANGLWGTVGGGQLEHIIISKARRMLEGNVLNDTLDVPLGPEIGQCCGGRVEVSLSQMSGRDKDSILMGMQKEDDALPWVYIMGAGHVGRAIANLMQHMPVHCVIIDTREEELALCSADVEKRLSAIPESDIKSAPAGSAFVVLTHDHALDFLLSAAALETGTASYVGLIGSATKRAKFHQYSKSNCDDLPVDQLVCPIGSQGSKDKRPEVIAAFVVAEVMTKLTVTT
ncbi:xanthine dehydrogenase accessory protein XdhC [Flexibacterium corallicola]|uniref:xanthine dehydrogenase accessory protein XdhC n=1 Tax=Flexibacterium corallicola TaxID=3037259 RepID=UPI00286EC1F3|nr:xanthine dehydrogenase accessory protein XdhC [Pseudovibrio sp. M1P-2-3]